MRKSPVPASWGHSGADVEGGVRWVKTKGAWRPIVPGGANAAHFVNALGLGGPANAVESSTNESA